MLMYTELLRSSSNTMDDRLNALMKEMIACLNCSRDKPNYNISCFNKFRKIHCETIGKKYQIG